MKNMSILLLTTFFLHVSANYSAGQTHGSNNRPITSASEVQSLRTGYQGPVMLGPLSINNRVGGIEFLKLMSMMQLSVQRRGLYVCFYDKSRGVYLVIERGADDHSLVRGMRLSRINVCPKEKIGDARGFAAWSTSEGIRLGSTEKDVLEKYGKPSEIREPHNTPHFAFSPYPMQGRPHDSLGDRKVLTYLPREGEPDTSHAFFGVRNGVVVWMTLSDNE